MSGQQQKNPRASEPMRWGEPPASGDRRAEPLAAKPEPESPAWTERLMEEVCDRENLQRAWKRVRSNKGAPGVDGMTIDDARDYLREHWPGIRAQLLDGTYQPQPVKRVEIPKPDVNDGKEARISDESLRFAGRRLKDRTRTWTGF